MKIVNKKKFIRTISILIGIGIIGLIIMSKSYSNADIMYKEYYIYGGDTLWSIAEEQIANNEYFENKDIRYVIFELQSINDLNNSNLSEGNIIKIPTLE